MEFVVQHELWIARALILRKQKKYGEAVRQYLDEGCELDALEIALEHINDVTQDPDTFNAIIAKLLWRYLSFGRRGIPASKISKLLEAIPLRGLQIERNRWSVGPVFFGELADLDRVARPFQASFPWKHDNDLPANSSRLYSSL